MTPRCHRTPHPHEQAGDTSAKENQMYPIYDRDGWLVNGVLHRSKENKDMSFLRILHDAHERFPFDPADVVPYAPGWPLGMTAMEYERQDVGRIASQAPNGALPLTAALPVARSA